MTRIARAQTTAATSSSDGTVTSTRSRLRKDFTTASSSSCATTSTGASLAHISRTCFAPFVDGVSNELPSSTASVSFPAWCESAPRSAALRAFRFTFTS